MAWSDPIPGDPVILRDDHNVHDDLPGLKKVARWIVMIVFWLAVLGQLWILWSSTPAGFVLAIASAVIGVLSSTGVINLARRFSEMPPITGCRP